jgi:hypothetical protein
MLRVLKTVLTIKQDEEQGAMRLLPEQIRGDISQTAGNYLDFVHGRKEEHQGQRVAQYSWFRKGLIGNKIASTKIIS